MRLCPDGVSARTTQTRRTMGKTTRPRSFDGLRVLIAGGGVAGLETMLALRELAGDLVDIELLSPEHHFWYRPLAVGEPFGVAQMQRFELTELVGAVGVAFTPGAIAAVEPEEHRVVTSRGAVLAYDVLVVACGTRPVPTLEGALTFRGPSDVDRLRTLLTEIEAGAARRIVFAVPRHSGWPLPLYELALMASAHVEDLGVGGVELSVVTHEPAPLASLGAAASASVTELIRERGLALFTGRYPLSFESGRLELVPAQTLRADRVVALARLEGQPVPGISRDQNGFVATDPSGRVIGFEDVYAAGDITRFP